MHSSSPFEVMAWLEVEELERDGILLLVTLGLTYMECCCCSVLRLFLEEGLVPLARFT